MEIYVTEKDQNKGRIGGRAADAKSTEQGVRLAIRLGAGRNRSKNRTELRKLGDGKWGFLTPKNGF